MDNDLKEAVSELLKGYNDLPKDFVRKLKSMNLYSTTLGFYDKIKSINNEELDKLVGNYVGIIEGLKKKSTKGASAADSLEPILLLLESYLFTSFFQLVGTYVLREATKDIINSNDIGELTKYYKELMQMEVVNENFLIEPFDSSIVEKRKKDIPVLKDSILQQMEVKSIQEQASKEEKPVEQYQHIFCNNGFGLFEYLLFNCTNAGKGHHSDIIYYYHRMKRDNFIHQPQQTFLNWYFEYTNNVHYIQNKPIHQVNSSNREMHYSNAFSWFKQQK